MKLTPFFAAMLAIAACVLAGCAHLEITPEGNPDRVLRGSIRFGAHIADAANAVVTVRLLDRAQSDLPAVVGEQRIVGVGTPPIPFEIEYLAEDDQLRRGLILEARVAVAGKLRFYTAGNHIITLANADRPQELMLEAVGGLRD